MSWSPTHTYTMRARTAYLGVSLIPALVALMCVAPRAARADTTVNGGINSDTTWTVAASPYLLSADVVVQAGATLTIEPGVTVRASTTGSDTELIVASGGTLLADASSGAAIVFEPSSGTSPSSWEGLTLQSGSSATLRNLQIRYADYAIDWTPGSPGAVTIDGIALTSCRYGVYVTGGTSVTVSGLTGTGAGVTTYWVYAAGSSTTLTVNDSVLRGGSYGVYAQNAHVHVNDTVIDGMASAGVYAASTANGAWQLAIDQCTMLSNGSAVQFYRNTTSSSRTLAVSIQRSIFGLNTTLASDASAGSYPPSSYTFTRNVIWGNTTNFYGSSPTQNETLTYNALLADPANGDYAPTDRSPARYHAIDDPAQIAGAVPFSGASTGDGVHGFWYVDYTFATSSVTDARGDVVVAHGATLTFLPGATLRFATTDVMAGGLNPGKAELRVEGTLEADGTLSRPVRLTSAATTPARGDWYGIVIPVGSEAFNVSQVDLGHAYRGVSLYGNDHIVAGSTIHDCSDAGVFVDAGTPNVEETEVIDNQRGVVVQSGAVVDLADVNIRRSTSYGLYVTDSSFTYDTGVVHDNGGMGIYHYLSSGSSRSGTIDHVTIAHNAGGGFGFGRNTTSSSRQITTQVVDASITHNTGYGLQELSGGSYAGAFSCATSNVYGNTTNYSAVTGGTSCFTYNPLYADTAGRDYTPTKHSPNRSLGGSGGHVGALAYDGDLGPHIEGYLWDGYSFTAAGSPYTVLGDLIVPSGTTVTIEPGAVLRVTPNADDMGGGLQSARVEIRVLSGGRLDAIGTGASSLITPNSSAPTGGMWYGVHMTDASTSVLDNLEIQYPTYGFWLEGPRAPRIEDVTILRPGTTGVYANGVDDSAGTAKVDLLATSIIGTGGQTGIQLANSSADIRSSYITHTSMAIRADASVNGAYDLYAVNNTLVRQGYGIYLYRNTSSSGRTLNAYMYNNVISGSATYSVADAGSPSGYECTDYLQYNDLRGGTVYGTMTANTNNITSDPLIEDDDWDDYARWWDGKVWSESLAINVGNNTATRIPSRDRLGRSRIIGSRVDMGAYEHDPTANREPRADSVTASIMVPRGEEFTFNGATAYDPDGTIASAYWTMSDGVVTAGQSVPHTFAAEGVGQWGYITVIDDDGAEDHARVLVNVNVRPVADAGPEVYADAGGAETVFFDGTLSYDPDGGTTRTCGPPPSAGQPGTQPCPVAWAWDFGDGATSTTPSPRHNYVSAGIYLVTLTITDDEGLTHSDTTIAHVDGVVDTVGPLVQHIEIADGQPIGTAVLVGATISDTSGVSTAYLFYRTMGSSTAAYVEMTNTAGSRYEAMIPASAVTAPGVEYWVFAVDGASPENDSTTPAGAPSTDVWDFLVTGDPNPPVIAHAEIADGRTNGEAQTVTATITDATGVGSASVYFRTTGATAFGAAAMTRVTGNTWTGQIPSFVVAPPGVQYYIEATDTSPIPNTGTAPAGAPSALYDFTVSSGDTAAPVIVHTPIANGQLQGTPVVITAGIVDTGGSVASAAVVYRASGTTGAYATLAMARATGNNWTATIPGVAVAPPGVEYYITATDPAANTATDPATAPATPYVFTVTAVDTAGPAIAHTPVADGQAPGVAVSVSATVTDPSGIGVVQLKYRPSSFPIFSTIDMTHAGGGVYTAQIPAFAVAAPSMHYYVRATDTAANESRAPATAPGTPYTFTVTASDATPPAIVHTPIANGQAPGVAVPVQAVVVDASDVSVDLLYRASGTAAWTTLAMSEGAPDVWAASIPAEAVTAAGVDYYIRATDAASNSAVSPATAPPTPYAFTVVAPDTTGPSILHTPITGTLDRLVDVGLDAIVFDESGLTSVTLSYRRAGTTTWSDVAMTNPSASNWTATIPGAVVLDPGVQYFLTAVDAAPAHSTSTYPAGGAAAPVSFSVPAADTTAPAIAHTPIATHVAGGDLTFSATITDAVGVASATVYIDAGTGFTALPMTRGAGDTWTAVGPWSLVPAGTTSAEYYIQARDAAGNVASSPAGGASAPYSIAIVTPDTSPPAVALTLVPDGQVAGAPVSVRATITDATGVASATLHYRTTGAATYDQIAMTPAGDVYSASVPGSAVMAPGVEYYVRAVDSAAGSNAAVAPTTAPSAPARFTVTPADTAGPAITHTTPAAALTAGASVELAATASDASGVAAVRLYWRTGASGAFTEVPTALSAGTYTATVGPVGAPSLEYYFRATDTLGNAATSPTGAPSEPHRVAVVTPDAAPPTIVHTPVPNGRSAGTAVAVAATITDTSGVASAQLRFRTAGSEAGFTGVAMAAGLAGEYTAVIPGVAIVEPGIEYYVEATDSAPAANVGRDPTLAPAALHAFTVGTVVVDTTPPALNHTAVASPQTAFTSVPVSATITDAGGVAAATLHFRITGGTWLSAAMSAVGDVYSAAIPAVVVTNAGVEYYLVASDAAGNTARSPLTAPAATHAFAVVTPDTAGPTISLSPVASPVDAGAAVHVAATIADPSGVASATLHFRATGSTSWLSTAMSGAGDAWSGTIPGAAVTAPGMQLYVTALDTEGNMSTSPSGAPGTPASFTVITPDRAPPSFAHAPAVGPIAAGMAHVVSATITDPSGVASATLYARVGGESSWTTTSMTPAGDVWSATIPARDVLAPRIEYYVVAVDGASPPNTGSSPPTAPAAFYSVAVVVPDLSGPAIALGTPLGPFVHGTPITLTAQVTDPSGVASVTLNTLSEGAAEWVRREMALVGGQYAATVPGRDVVEGELAWFVEATDGLGNYGVAPSGADGRPELIVIEAATSGDLDPPSIVHVPITTAFAGEPLELAAVVTDASDVDDVVLYVQIADSGVWLDEVMERSGDTFRLTIDAADMLPGVAFYYIEAIDASPAYNATTLPLGAPANVFEVRVTPRGGGDAGGDTADTGADAAETGGEAGTDADEVDDVSTDTPADDVPTDTPVDDVSTDTPGDDAAGDTAGEDVATDLDGGAPDAGDAGVDTAGGDASGEIPDVAGADTAVDVSTLDSGRRGGGPSGGCMTAPRAGMPWWPVLCVAALVVRRRRT